MEITIEEQTCIRLGHYAKSKGLLSLAAAIDHLLANQPNPLPRPIPPRPVGGRLEIVYSPANEENFKRALLDINPTDRAVWVRIHYADKRVEERLWKAQNITADSRIRENLLSGYLRGWKRKGVVKAEAFLSPPDMTFADSVKERYKEFVRERVQVSSNAEGYANALEHLLQNHGVNVWPMTSIEEVHRVYQRLLKNGDLCEVSRRYRNGIMSAAVKQFIAFLESENGG